MKGRAVQHTATYCGIVITTDMQKWIDILTGGVSSDNIRWFGRATKVLTMQEIIDLYFWRTERLQKTIRGFILNGENKTEVC